MKIQLVPATDYEQVHQLRDYSFPSKYEGTRRDDFQYWMENSTTIGAYDHQKLVGQLLVLPLNMTVQGVSYEMGGIGFVSTYPEYRNQGITKNLMIRSLEEMRKNHQYISVLAPFSVSFYRHFGWELFFDKLHYSIPAESFPQYGNRIDKMKRFSFEWIDEATFLEVQQFHNEQALKNNGGMQRDASWWKRIARREPDCHFAAYFDGETILGYIRYRIKNLTFTIQDFVTKDMQAEQAMWRFITSHKSSVHTIEGDTSTTSHFGFYFEQPQFKKEVSQDVMVRIVDVFAFLKKYSWSKLNDSLYLYIQDTFAPWNEKLFHINKYGEIGIIEESLIDKKHILSLPITIFSAMIVGYLSIRETLLFAKHSIDEETEEKWKNAINYDPPTFYEYF
ncbi:GNAT family N-acetyltransferase [Psychrobacillus psychrodurans]|uniref:GNAT family N-acetyltransferase n=1 Tax=Psychrobacillus TaxID=1221880 RepID=UPI001F4E0C8C|nr:GNAT family N-acetyltransferase [Psychrobacillus psychrodurans]MCK1996915.1 GNAT family N-acetyltransferase [Psychrobacillus psychrodurans]